MQFPFPLENRITNRKCTDHGPSGPGAEYCTYKKTKIKQKIQTKTTTVRTTKPRLVAERKCELL